MYHILSAITLLSPAYIHHARACFHRSLEPRVLRLIGRQTITRLIQRQERVRDAVRELRLVRHLPRLERLQVLDEKRGKVLGQLRRLVLETPRRSSRALLLFDRAQDLLKRRKQRFRRFQQRVVQTPMLSNTWVG